MEFELHETRLAGQSLISLVTTNLRKHKFWENSFCKFLMPRLIGEEENIIEGYKPISATNLVKMKVLWNLKNSLNWEGRSPEDAGVNVSKCTNEVSDDEKQHYGNVVDISTIYACHKYSPAIHDIRWWKVMYLMT